MSIRELTCIGCPLGCSLEVDLMDMDNIKVNGAGCGRGESYGIKECTNPTRIVTTTVKIAGGSEIMLPVKTEKDIPKELIFECIKKLKNIEVTAPVKTGDIVVPNILNTGINIVATEDVNKNA